MNTRFFYFFVSRIILRKRKQRRNSRRKLNRHQKAKINMYVNITQIVCFVYRVYLRLNIQTKLLRKISTSDNTL